MLKIPYLQLTFCVLTPCLSWKIRTPLNRALNPFMRLVSWTGFFLFYFGWTGTKCWYINIYVCVFWQGHRVLASNIWKIFFKWVNPESAGFAKWALFTACPKTSKILLKIKASFCELDGYRAAWTYLWLQNCVTIGFL